MGNKSQRPSGMKVLGLERIARGTATASSEVLFQVKLSGNKYKRFSKKDALEYNKPELKTSVRCIYHGKKDSTFPYAVYDMNWNVLYKEK
jgi:hypothetical protein